LEVSLEDYFAFAPEFYILPVKSKEVATFLLFYLPCLPVLPA
jgi:hypothetical protein